MKKKSGLDKLHFSEERKKEIESLLKDLEQSHYEQEKLLKGENNDRKTKKPNKE